MNANQELMRREVERLLLRLNNEGLAKVLEDHVNQTDAPDVRVAVNMFWNEHIAEARHRVGNIANAKADEDLDKWKAKWAPDSDGYTEQDWDDLMDNDEAYDDFPRGEVYYLIDALRASNAVRNELMKRYFPQPPSDDEDHGFYVVNIGED